MKFRFHKGSLADSMETVVEINNFYELKKLLYEAFPECDGQKITIKHACYDNRINWDTYYVCLDGKCVGMSDGVLKTYKEHYTEAMNELEEDFKRHMANELIFGIKQNDEEEKEIKIRKWSIFE